MKKNIFILPLAMVLLLITALPSSIVEAHGAGQSMEKVGHEYLVDFSIGELTLTTGESVRYTFELMLNESKEDVSFTSIWVRLMEGRKLLFAVSLKAADFGVTGFSYAFQKGGEYELTAKFQNEEKTLVETSFPLSVEEDTSAFSEKNNTESQLPTTLILVGVIGLAVGFSLSHFIKKA